MPTTMRKKLSNDLRRLKKVEGKKTMFFIRAWGHE